MYSLVCIEILFALPTRKIRNLTVLAIAKVLSAYSVAIRPGYLSAYEDPEKHLHALEKLTKK